MMGSYLNFWVRNHEQIVIIPRCTRNGDVRVARKNGWSISFFLDFFSLFDQAKRGGYEN